ncbi:tetratricopeptide repeat protein [Streptomyces sp. NPDC050842]|uniref:tetratricopeptide repeat protein n=1 Tax=Streptomyces sp. NPDC050842 TaxID=3365636 RepID=UPI0037B6D445
MTLWRKRRTEERVAVGGNVGYSAVGPYSSVVVHQAAPPGADAVAWPLEVGAVPALASAFQPRAEVRERIDALREEGETAVLTQVLSGGGGVGKSQLAASYASQAVAEGVDLVVWAPAAEIQQVVTRFAEAGVRVAAPGVTGADPEADARAFLAWLATTSRRWLVVLDDIADPGAVEGWWPGSRTGSGWVLATTRLHDARLTGGGRRRVSVDVYGPGEAAAYLRARLADDGLADGAVGELAAELGHLPLALGHAAAYMINHGLGCAAYLELFRGSRSITELLPPSADAEGYGRAIATTLLLSLDAAEAAGPAGAARRVLGLAALLDPAGHPEALWRTEAVLAYLGGCGADDARAALRVLHRYALLTCDGDSVRIHALTARAVRETIPEEGMRGLVRAAADGLLHLWPTPDQPHRGAASVLRANTEILAHAGEQWLVRPTIHGVLYRCGASLGDAGMVSSAIDYWAGLLAASVRLLPPGHPAILVTRANLAMAYGNSHETAKAVELGEQVVAAHEREFGAEDLATLVAKSNLAAVYIRVRRTAEAVTLGESVLAAHERILGMDHPDTLVTRANLAASYLYSGRLAEAVALDEQVLVDRERRLGADHPDTLLARANLAYSYNRAGALAEATGLLARAAADAERVLGPEHPDTLTYGEALRSLQAQPRPLWRRILRR